MDSTLAVSPKDELRAALDVLIRLGAEVACLELHG